jgi:hypothetical protein
MIMCLRSFIIYYLTSYYWKKNIVYSEPQNNAHVRHISYCFKRKIAVKEKHILKIYQKLNIKSSIQTMFHILIMEWTTHAVPTLVVIKKRKGTPPKYFDMTGRKIFTFFFFKLKVIFPLNDDILPYILVLINFHLNHNYILIDDELLYNFI